MISITPAPADGIGTLDPFAFTITLSETTRGDGGALYMTAFSIGQLPHYDTEAGKQRSDENNALQEMTPATLDQAMAERQLDFGEDRLKLAAVAARRATCTWGFSWREQGFEALLPSLNEARMTANLLSFRAKLHAARGQWDAWADDVRIMAKMGNDVGNHAEPVLVEGLVGIGINALALRQVEEAHEVAGMPNAYWPLATMPLDFDFARLMQVERAAVFASFPELSDPDRFTADDFAAYQRRLAYYKNYEESGRTLVDAAKATLAGMMLQPAAKTYLVDRGHFTAEEIEAMGPWPAVAHYLIESYDDAWRDVAKHATLPPPGALERLSRDEEFLAESETIDGTLVAVVFPAIGRAYEAPYRLERTRRLLMIVEALRDHAAKTGGLPASLDEVELHVPLDPFTDAPFGYRVDRTTAILTAEPYRPADPERTGFDWYIDLRAE